MIHEAEFVVGKNVCFLVGGVVTGLLILTSRLNNRPVLTGYNQA